MAKSSQEAQLPPAKRFTLFDQLPSEIRSYIWEFARPPPRIVYIKQLRILERRSRGGLLTAQLSVLPKRRWDNELWGIKSFCPVPSTLLVNRESFGVASKYYERAFACHDDGEEPIFPKPAFAQTWFDFSQDILYIDEKSFEKRHDLLFDVRGSSIINGLYDICRKDVERVTSLALHVGFDPVHLKDEDGPVNKKKWVCQILETMGKVSKLYAVTHHTKNEKIEMDYDLEALNDLTFWDVPGEKQIFIEDWIEVYTKALVGVPPKLILPQLGLPDLKLEGLQLDIVSLLFEERGWNDDLRLEAEENPEWAYSIGIRVMGEDGLVIGQDLAEKRDGNHDADEELSDLESDSDEISSPWWDIWPTKTLWKSPEIEHKVTLSAGLRQKVTELRAEYHAKIEDKIKDKFQQHEWHGEGECQCGWELNFSTGHFEYSLLD